MPLTPKMPKLTSLHPRAAALIVGSGDLKLIAELLTELGTNLSPVKCGEIFDVHVNPLISEGLKSLILDNEKHEAVPRGSKNNENNTDVIPAIKPRS